MRENGLSFTLAITTLLTLGRQLVVDWHTVNNGLTDYHQPAISFARYLISGHCIEAVFEPSCYTPLAERV